MGRGIGIFLMILGVIGLFYGTAIIPQYPTLSDSAIQIISIVVFIIGLGITGFSRPKYPR